MHRPPDDSPLAYIAATRGGTSRARKDLRLAAVLAEFGYATHIAAGSGEPWDVADRLDALGEASLVVCDVVCPADDIPVEVALAATQGTAVIVLAPAGVAFAGLAGDLLADCDATLIRYDGIEPHRALHARLLADAGALAAAERHGRFARA